MLPIKLSGEWPSRKRGPKAGRQAHITPKQGSIEVQMKILYVSSGKGLVRFFISDLGAKGKGRGEAHTGKILIVRRMNSLEIVYAEGTRDTDAVVDWISI